MHGSELLQYKLVGDPVEFSMIANNSFSKGSCIETVYQILRWLT